MNQVSKTPQFDKALDEYFSKLELDEKGGQWRTCRFSGEKFYVRPEDIEFYKKMRVPLPTLSPKERIRRKIAFTNSYNLFKVVSSFSKKSIISQYPPTTPYKVYEHQMWFGEEWDPNDYASAYTDSRGFFDQFGELMRNVPRPNLHIDSTSIRSDYTNNSTRLKNCYLIFDSYQSEDSAYSISLIDSRSCFDGFALRNSDTCYDCFESSDLFNCFFVEHSKHCLYSYFLFDCRDCEYCFGCVNLRHKKYHFFNEPLTKKAYEEKIRALNLGDRESLNSLKGKFTELKKKAFYKETHNDRAVASFGDYIKDSKNCYACFYIIGGENVAYSIGVTKTRDSYDIVGGVGTEFSYESWAGDNNYGIKFSIDVDDCREIEYCDLCINCHDCFGCIGLKNKSFCILNKQYAEKDYWEMVDKVKAKMLEKGEYGEFFPPKLSPFPYNISIATSYKGYDDVETARRYGYRTEDIQETLYEVEGEIVDSKDLPKDIREVKDDILNKVVFDSENNKKSRYIKAELEFYRRYNLPLPQKHYSVRLAEKRKKFGSIVLELYERKCVKCGKSMQSSYSPDRPETVYCEQCYQAEVV
ncbi:MAG: hypothetical protein KJI72_00985 [Patescibacteria group bacterium]|nr:hypothetical protein [Patescibacteria group bacterium]